MARAIGDSDEMTFAADRLADWGAARQIGSRLAGPGPTLSAVQRARLREDFADVVPEAERLALEHTGMTHGGYPSRPWVMSRSEWLRANLRGFQTLLEPIAARIVTAKPDSAVTSVRRKVLGAEIGSLVGYLGRRVLGQYDLFLPPDDDGMIYFVGPNIAGVERRYGFPERDFRLWIALHEVAHRLQFGSVPWLRPHVSRVIDAYMSTLELDARELVRRLGRAMEEVRAGRVEWRGLGWLFLLMDAEQRRMFREIQSLMALLEGHGNFVMNVAGRDAIRGVDTFRRTLRERRRSSGPDRLVQRAIGFDAKVRQYDAGEWFVASVVQEVGMERFNRVWLGPETIPTPEEISRPQDWIARVGAA
ncbi:MAG TPA: zinc-dependent metalloprotease [Actinomycetota bacterium]|jgi:coenzyme F420 biosynthesis associated uncharacterized protein